jgi:ABC-type lipoprotein release transport system permease subunit
MITLGLLGCLVAATLVLTLTAFPRRFNSAATYSRVAWLPVAALFVEAILWKPLLTRLSYFAVVPLLLTCIASFLLTAVGATLVATARARNERSSEVLRATLIAAIPAMLLLALMFYGFVNTILGSSGA